MGKGRKLEAGAPEVIILELCAPFRGLYNFTNLFFKMPRNLEPCPDIVNMNYNLDSPRSESDKGGLAVVTFGPDPAQDDAETGEGRRRQDQEQHNLAERVPCNIE